MAWCQVAIFSYFLANSFYFFHYFETFMARVVVQILCSETPADERQDVTLVFCTNQTLNVPREMYKTKRSKLRALKALRENVRSNDVIFNGLACFTRMASVFLLRKQRAFSRVISWFDAWPTHNIFRLFKLSEYLFQRHWHLFSGTTFAKLEEGDILVLSRLYLQRILSPA